MLVSFSPISFLDDLIYPRGFKYHYTLINSKFIFLVVTFEIQTKNPAAYSVSTLGYPKGISNSSA